MNKLSALGWNFWSPAGLATLWFVILILNSITLITETGSVWNLIFVVLSVIFIVINVRRAKRVWESKECRRS